MFGLFWVGKKGDRRPILLACILAALPCIGRPLACTVTTKGDIGAMRDCHAALKARAGSLLSWNALRSPHAGTRQRNDGPFLAHEEELLASLGTMQSHNPAMQGNNAALQSVNALMQASVNPRQASAAPFL